MKRFLLKQMTLLSQVEEKGRKIKFDPRVTVIRGDNDRGKSSLIKSIVSCLGAQPPMVQNKWKLAKVQGLLEFDVDGKQYWALANNGAHALFDAKGRVINSSLGVTKGFGPALAKVLDFKLKLRSQSGETLVPPPAFYLLPYYVDQDRGWNNTWCSFERLTQFSAFKVPVAEYHTGIRPNEFYEQKALLAEHEAQRAVPEAKRQLLERVAVEFTRSHSKDLFDIDVLAFGAEIDRLMKTANALKEKQSTLKDKLVEQHSERTTLVHQLAIVEHAQRELNADYVFVTKTLKDSSVSCPTCGQEYDNKFAERFGIAQDEERCAELAIEIKGKLRSTDEAIIETKRELASLNGEASEIEALLKTRKGTLELSDVLQNEGTKQVRKFLRVDIEQLDLELTALDERIQETEKRLSQFSDPEHRRSVLDLYEKLFRKHLLALDVNNLDENVFSQIAPTITESGSDLPRAILAYIFSIAHLIARKPSAALGPLIIDSPKQQEQDTENEKRILEFIRDRRPEGNQLILGTVNTSGVEFKGEHVVLDQKFSALAADQYDDCREIMMPFLERSLEIDATEEDGDENATTGR